MAAGRLFIPGWMPARDSDGDPIPNVSASFYQNETDVLAVVYADESLTIPLANPVQANSSGRFPQIYADDSQIFSVSVEAPYGPPGQPRTFDGLSASQAADIAAANLAEGTVEEVEFAIQAAIEAGGAAGPAGALAGQAAAQAVVTNKADSNGGNTTEDVASRLRFQSKWGAAAILRNIESKLTETVSILDYIPVALHAGIKDGTNTTDLQPYFQALIADYSPALFVVSGVRVIVPPGRYRVESSIDMTGAHGLVFEGLAKHAAEIYAPFGSNFPVFVSENTAAAPLVYAGVRNLTIRGGGNDLANAHGIKVIFGNTCDFSDNQIYSCRHGLHLRHQFETLVRNNRGGGSPDPANTDRCYIGVFQGRSTTAFVDNAIIWEGNAFYFAILANLRVVNGQGSSYSGMKTGGGTYSVIVGAPGEFDDDTPAGQEVECRWLHFGLVLGDSNNGSGGLGWLFKKGAAPKLSQIIIDNLWIGNTTLEGVVFDGATQVEIDGLLAVRTGRHSLRLSNCSRVTVSGLKSINYNMENGGYSPVLLENSTDCIIANIDHSIDGEFGNPTPQPCVVETGTSDRNLVVGCNDNPTLVGASSQFYASKGAYGWQVRRANNALAAIISGAGQTAYLGLGTTANPLLHNVFRDAAGGIGIWTNGETRKRFGSGVGVFEFANTTAQPDVPYQATVANLVGLDNAHKGALAWATNGRKPSEGAGAGTGVPVYYNGNGIWNRCSDHTQVVA